MKTLKDFTYNMLELSNNQGKLLKLENNKVLSLKEIERDK